MGELAMLRSSKPGRSQQAGEPEQTDGGQAMRHRSRKVAHDKHQTANVNQQPDSLHAHGSGQCQIDPLTRCQLGGRSKEHG